MISKSQIKYLKSLSKKKYRKENGQFVVEGLRSIKELIESNHKIEKIWTTENFLCNHPDFKKKIISLDCELINQNDLSYILNTKSPQDIMALVPMKVSDKKIKVSGKSLILDNISDPGNMGTLLRTAAWYGINNIMCSRNSVDIYNPKVVRSAMGAHFHIDNLLQSNMIDTIQALKSQDIHLIAATLNGVSHKKFKVLNDNWALILGSEANGIREEIIQMVDSNISILREGRIDSLNVSVAGSIILDQLVN
tara:strand:- start:1094 stop:1846 length:753 start_codon:yes stop_codon:yes gene_type:complete